MAFLDFLIDLLVLGDSFISLRRVTDGSDEERESPLYDAPEMRRLRWIARVVVLAYLIAIVAAAIGIILYIDSDFRRSAIAGHHLVAGLIVYIGLVWLGFWLLKRIFRRKRQAIAAQLAPATGR